MSRIIKIQNKDSDNHSDAKLLIGDQVDKKDKFNNIYEITLDIPKDANKCSVFYVEMFVDKVPLCIFVSSYKNESKATAGLALDFEEDDNGQRPSNIYQTDGNSFEYFIFVNSKVITSRRFSEIV